MTSPTKGRPHGRQQRALHGFGTVRSCADSSLPNSASTGFGRDTSRLMSPELSGTLHLVVLGGD